MLDVMYEIPGSDDVIGVKITKPVVLGDDKPLPPPQDKTRPPLDRPEPGAIRQANIPFQ